MSEKYGKESTNWGVCGDDMRYIPRIEITPNDTYGLSDIHARIVPELESVAKCNLNSNVTYSKQGGHLVVELSPQRDIKTPEEHLDRAVKNVAKKYPELKNYLQVTYKEVKNA